VPPFSRLLVTFAALTQQARLETLVLLSSACTRSLKRRTILSNFSHAHPAADRHMNRRGHVFHRLRLSTKLERAAPLYFSIKYYELFHNALIPFMIPSTRIACP